MSNYFSNIPVNNIPTRQMSAHDIASAHSNPLPELDGPWGGQGSTLDWETSVSADLELPESRTLEAIIEERRESVVNATNKVATSSDFDNIREQLSAFIRDRIAANADFMKTEGTIIREAADASANHGTGLVLDEDLTAARAAIIDTLKAASEPVKDAYDSYIAMTKALFAMYKSLGKALETTELELRRRLRDFDEVRSRIRTLTGVRNQECAEYQALAQALHAYLKANYVDYAVDEQFARYIDLYKQWNMLRDIVLSVRAASVGSVSNTPNCGVCIEDPVAAALTGCGHTFCLNCLRQLGRQCPICRKAISGSIKIYFS